MGVFIAFCTKITHTYSVFRYNDTNPISDKIVTNRGIVTILKSVVCKVIFTAVYLSPSNTSAKVIVIVAVGIATQISTLAMVLLSMGNAGIMDISHIIPSARSGKTMSFRSEPRYTLLLLKISLNKNENTATNKTCCC